MARTLLRRTLVGLVLLAVAVLVWTAAVLVLVRDDLAQARADLTAAQEDGGGSGDDVDEALERAEGRLDGAADRLGQVGPRLGARVPVLGRTVRAVDRTTRAALAVTSTARAVLAATADVELTDDSRVDLATLDRLQTTLSDGSEDTREPVRALLRQRGSLVPGAVAGPLAQAQETLAGVPDALAAGASGVQALRGLLGEDGPRRLLVVLDNNAELRGTGGVVTVFAEATTEDGRLDLEPFRDVVDVADSPDEARVVPAPADYRTLWGPFLADTTLWLNTNMTPDAETAASVLAEVGAVTLPQRPDAVLRLDVPAVAAVLSATGPAVLPDGSTVAGDEAVDVLLSRAYTDAPDTVEGQAQRRATLRAVADSVLARLLGGGSASLRLLGPALVEAANGRHLSVWSADDQEQQRLRRAGLAGEVEAGSGDIMSVAVQNLGGGDTDGNKLDYYATRTLDVRTVVSDDAAQVHQRFVLTNGAPATGLPRYVAGGASPGTSNNLVSLALPAGAQDVVLRRGGQPLDSRPRPQEDHAVVTDVVALPPGASVQWDLEYRLPLESGDYRLAVVPQALHADADLSVRISPVDGRRLALPVDSALTRDGDDAVLDGPLSATSTLSAGASRPGRLSRAVDAVQRFWREPVAAPW